MRCLDVDINSARSFLIDSYVFNFQTFLCNYSYSYGPNNKRRQNEMKRRSSFVKKRGFQCHFNVKFMGQIHEIAIITYNTYEHEDSQGWPFHGQHDTSGHARSVHQPKLQGTCFPR